MFNFRHEKQFAHSDDYDFESKVRDVLFGRKIVETEVLDGQTARIKLDNGVELFAVGNEGCGGCMNGWYFLDELNDCDNVITDVTCETGVSEFSDDDVYHIFVYADNKKINCLQFSGHDNGYYGTGYLLVVRCKE